MDLTFCKGKESINSGSETKKRLSVQEKQLNQTWFRPTLYPEEKKPHTHTIMQCPNCVMARLCNGQCMCTISTTVNILIEKEIQSTCSNHVEGCCSNFGVNLI